VPTPLHTGRVAITDRDARSAGSGFCRRPTSVALNSSGARPAHVRNPMYLAVASTIVGQALILGQPDLLVYTAIFAVAVSAFLHAYEEPTLAARC